MSLIVQGSWPQSYFQHCVNFQLRTFRGTSSLSVISLNCGWRLSCSQHEHSYVTKRQFVQFESTLQCYYIRPHKLNTSTVEHVSVLYLQRAEQVCSVAPPLEEALLEWASPPLEKTSRDGDRWVCSEKVTILWLISGQGNMQWQENIQYQRDTFNVSMFYTASYI